MSNTCNDFDVQGLYSTEQLQARCLKLGLHMNLNPCHLNEDPKEINNCKIHDVCADEYEVEEIVDCVQEKGQIWFLVKWRDWEESFNTWEPERNLSNSREAISKYFTKKKSQHRQYIEGDTGGQLLKTYNRRHTRTFIRKILNDEDVATMLKFCGKTYAEFLESGKTPKQLCKDIRSVVESYFAKGKGDKNFPVLTKTLTSNNGVRSELFDFAEKRRSVLKKLNAWVSNINKLPGVRVPILIENDYDLEGPPENFTYITDYKAGEGIIIPDDPLVGCSCSDCYKQQKSCCVAQSTGEYAYNKFGYVRVPEGTPIYECNKRCLCSDDCSNRVVQKGRTVKLAIFRTHDGRGWGVKSLERIKKGQFVMEYVGEVITTEEAENRGKIYDAEGRTYLFDLDFNEGDIPFTVDAARLGNIAHFMNHSCDPNLYVFTVWINNLDPRLPRIAFFAKHDIKKGEELTFDYKMSAEGPGESTPNRATVSPYRTSTSKKPNDPQPSTPTRTHHVNDVESMETDENENMVDVAKRIPCKCGTVKCRKYLY